MGQSQVWYAESEFAQKEFIPKVLDYLASEKNKCERFYFNIEEFSERAYSDSCLQNMLKNAGLEVLAVLGDNSFNAPQPNEERIIYVTRKRS